MPVPRRSLRPLGWLVCALAFAGCATDTTTSGETGGATILLELADGTQIDEVSYVVSGNDMPDMSGVIDTSAPGSTASIEIYGIGPGRDYLIGMTATSTDGETTCSGSAFFDVAVGEVTDVMVILNCKLPRRLGGVRVNGKLNVCASLAKVVVSPLQTSVGNDIDVFAHASDLEGDEITYQWAASSGSFADPSTAITTYTCEEVGDHTLAVAVSDDDFVHCEHGWTVDVTCVDGDGGAGGSGGAGGQAGSGGVAGAGGEAGGGGIAGAGGGAGGVGGMAGAGGGAGGVGGMAGEGGIGGSSGTGGEAGSGGMGGTAGAGGAAGSGGVGGSAGSGGGDNLCPRLFVINAIPSTIPPGNTTTMVETRGQDTDGVPMPLVLTLRALWGSFANTDNIQLPNNVVAQNATYICDRPGSVELCVDATDGACVKTLCTNVSCPSDVVP